MKSDAREVGLPGRGRYVIAILLLALAILGVPGGVMWLMLNQPKPTQFLAPGPCDFTAAQPGKYVLWHEYDTIFGGVTYSSNALPSGLTITCRDAATGTNLSVRGDRGATMSTMNLRRASVAAVDIPAPGRYLVSVEGSSQPMLFSFGPAVLGKFFGAVLGAIPVAFALLIGGVALAAHTLIRRSQILKPERPQGTTAQGFNR